MLDPTPTEPSANSRFTGFLAFLTVWNNRHKPAQSRLRHASCL